MPRLIAQLKRHEGLELKPYKCTANKTTIGYGRNLDDKGISEGEAESMLWADVAEVRDTLADKWSPFDNLDPVRKAALINMGFNLGITGLFGFRNMLDAVGRGDFERAADEMLDSRWAKQVGNRATELAEQMRSGEWGEEG